MNIVEVYIKVVGKLVIFVSGLSGSGRSALGKNISRDFKIPLLNINKFCKKDYSTTIKLANGEEIINWDSDDIYNWDLINAEINKLQSNGVVVVGTVFPTDKVTVKPDFHIHIKLAKQSLIKRRERFTEDHKDDCSELYKLNKSEVGLLILNSVTLPYYYESLKKTLITKFISANDYADLDEVSYDRKIYDEVWDYIIQFIEKHVEQSGYIPEDNKNERPEEKPKHTNLERNKQTKKHKKNTDKKVTRKLSRFDRVNNLAATDENEQNDNMEEDISSTPTLSSEDFDDEDPWIWRPW
jgi:cytidylate kinase